MKRLKLLWYNFQLLRISDRANRKIQALGQPRGEGRELIKLLEIWKEEMEAQKIIHDKIRALKS